MTPAPFLESTPKRKYATPNDLDRIEGIWYQTKGTFNLSRCGRSLLQFFVTVARLGYHGVDAPIGAITNSFWRSLGNTCSERTVYRALNDLEKHGFVLRRTFRVGENRLKCLIRFELDSMRFMLAEKEPTQAHINTQLTKCQSDDRMNINLRVNSCNSSDLNNMSRAGARTSNRQTSKPSKRYHPIITTLRIVTTALCNQKRLTWKARRAALSLADLEVNNSDLYRSRSGIPWELHETRWPSMSIEERDGIAAREILPILLRGDRQNGQGQITDTAPEQLTDTAPEQLTDTAPEQLTDTDPEQLTAVVKSLLSGFKYRTQPSQAELEISADEPEHEQGKINLDSEDLALLEQARDRIQARVHCI